MSGTLVPVSIFDDLRSPFARAVVPVVTGFGVILLLGVFLWAMAAFISRGDATTSERLAPSTFQVGPVEAFSEKIAEEGPLLIAGLNTTTGERSLVIDHTGSNPADGWVVYWAYPADREPSCVVTQVIGTADFTDCDGRTIAVDELAPPTDGVRPIVESRETLSIDLRGVTETTDVATTVAG